MRFSLMIHSILPWLGMLSVFPWVKAAAEFCPSIDLCIQTKVAPNATTIDLIIRTTVINGWLSVGAGASMSKGDVVACIILNDFFSMWSSICLKKTIQLAGN
jgi:hypothetical protein